MAEIEEKNIIKENSKKYAGQLWNLITEQIERQSANQEKLPAHLAPPKKESKNKWLIKLLFFFPVLLLGGFITSFWWDFNGISTTLFGYDIVFEGLLKVLTISA